MVNIQIRQDRQQHTQEPLMEELLLLGERLYKVSPMGLPGREGWFCPRKHALKMSSHTLFLGHVK